MFLTLLATHVQDALNLTYIDTLYSLLNCSFFFRSTTPVNVTGVCREIASLLVTNAPDGSYLLRESAKFKTQLVLSFNYRGSARHILFSVSVNGSCSFYTADGYLYCFKTIKNFIDYFSKYPLYLNNDQEPIKLSGMIDINEPVYV